MSKNLKQNQRPNATPLQSGSLIVDIITFEKRKIREEKKKKKEKGTCKRGSLVWTLRDWGRKCKRLQSCHCFVVVEQERESSRREINMRNWDVGVVGRAGGCVTTTAIRLLFPNRLINERWIYTLFAFTRQFHLGYTPGNTILIWTNHWKSLFWFDKNIWARRQLNRPKLPYGIYRPTPCYSLNC